MNRCKTVIKLSSTFLKTAPVPTAFHFFSLFCGSSSPAEMPNTSVKLDNARKIPYNNADNAKDFDSIGLSAVNARRASEARCPARGRT